MGQRIFTLVLLLGLSIQMAYSQCSPPIPTPTISFNPSNPCGEYDVFIAASPTSTDYEYMWTFDDGTLDTLFGTNVVHNFPAMDAANAIYNIILTMTDVNGCSETISTPIDIQATPTFDVIGNFSACLPSFSNQTTFTTVFEVQNGPAGASYNWFFGDGTALFNNTDATVSHTYTEYGTFQLVVQTSNGNCIGSFEQEVTFYIRPTANMNIIGDPDICEGDTMHVQNNTDPTHVLFYVWDWGNGERDTVYNNDDAFYVYEFGDDVICNSPPAAGAEYEITLYAVNDCLQHSNASPIFVSLQPHALVSQPDTVCASNPTVNFGNESCPDPSLGYYDVNEYFWDFGDGTTSTDISPTHVFPGPGVYSVILVASNDCGDAIDTVEVVVIEDPVANADVTLNASAGANGEFCIPMQVDLMNQSTGDSITFVWEVISTNPSENPGWEFINGTDSVSANPEIDITLTGNYLIQLTVSNLCDDVTWDTLIQTIEPPTIALDPIGDFCDTTSISPTYTLDSGSSGFLNFNWQFPGGLPSSSSDPNPSDIFYGAPGIYDVSVTVANACGSDTDNVSFEIDATPEADMGGDLAFCIDDDPEQLSATPTGGVFSGPGITSDGLFTPLFAGEGTHEIVYANLALECPAFDTIEIIVHPLPIVDAGPPQSICENEGNLTLTGATPLGGNWSGPGIIDPSNGIMDPEISGIGSFNMIYTYTNANGCTNSDFKVVDIIGLPVINAGDTILFCDIPENLQITGYSPAGGTWTGVGIVDADAGLFNPTIAGGVGFYDAIYTFTDVNGCTNTDTLVINVDVLLEPSAGNDLEFCIDEPQLDLTATPNGGTWSGPGIISSGDGTFYAQASGVGVHEIVYTVGAGSCAISDTIEIRIFALPNVGAGFDVSVCEDEPPFTFGGFSPQGGVWTGIGIIDAITGEFDPSIPGVGTHTATYTYVNSLTGCENSDDKLITVLPLPNVEAGDPVILCDAPINVQLEDFSPAGGIWTGAGITDPNVGTFNPQGAGGVGNYEVYYTYTDNNGCTNSDTLDIEVVTPPIVEAGPNDSLCIDDPQLLLSGYSPFGGVWTGTGIVDPNGGVFDPSVAGAGSHVLTYTAGIGSCEESDTKTVLVSPLPPINPGSDLDVCADETAFTLPSFFPQDAQWSGFGITDPAGIFDPQVAGIGTHTITLSYTDPNTGCYNEDNIDITVNPLPIVEAGNPVVYCPSSDNITLTNYTPLGGTWSGLGIVDPTNGIFNVDVAGGVGQYNLEYSYTDGNSCTSVDTLIVTVISGDSVDPGPNDTICIDNGLWQLTGYAPLGGNWSGPGIVNSVDGTFDPVAATVGLHTLTYTVGTGTCLRTATKTIWVAGLPFVNAGEDEEVCIDEPPFQFTGFFPESGGTWTGNGVDALGTFDPEMAGAGTQVLTYTYIDPVTGCVNSDDKEVLVDPLPIVNAGDTTTYCDNPDNITLGGYSPLGGVWDGTGIVDPTNGIFNTEVAGGVGVYDVSYTFTDANGCVDSDTLVLNIEFGDVVDAGQDTAICIDYGFYTITDFSPPGGTWSGTGIIDPNNGLFDPVTAGGGLHTLTYTFGDLTCEKTDTKTILVGTIPVVNAGPNETGCSADPAYMLTGFSPPGGVWTGQGIIDPDGIFEPALAGTGTHTLTYTYTNPVTGCVNSDTKTINLEAAPIVDAGQDIEICNVSDDITFTGYSPLGGLWSGPGIIDQVNGIFNAFVAGGPGTYTVAYGYTSSNGCYNEDSLDVVVLPLPIIDPGPDTSMCISDGIFVMNDFSPAGGIWSGTGIVATSGVFDPVVAGLGVHILTYTYGENTCEVSDIRRILVGTPPIVIAGDDEIICEDTAPYTLTGASPQGGFWSGSGIMADSATFDPIAVGIGTHTVTYTYINEITGCESSDDRDITIEAIPVVTVSDTIVYCNTFDNITLSGYNPFGGIWSGPGVVDANNATFNTVVAGGEGIYEIYYDFSSSNGCSARDSAIIEIIYGDSIDAGPDTAICIVNGLLNLTNGMPTGGFWSGSGIISPAGVFDPVLAGAGLHTVTYTNGDDSCEKSDEIEIFVGTAPNVVAGPDEDVCLLIASYQLQDFNPPGGTWSGTGVDPSGIFDPATAGLGTHTLTYSYTNPLTGCDNSDTKLIDVVPVPTVYVGDTIMVCETPDNINLDESPAGGVWSGPGILDALEGIFNTGSAGGIGQYELIYVFEQNNGCDGRDTVIIDVIPAEVVVAGSPDTICIDGGLFTLVAGTPSGGVWSGDGIVDPFLGVFDPLAVGTGLSTVTYTYGEETCERSDSKNILVGAIPNIDPGSDMTVCEDESIFDLTGYSPQGGTWSGSGITDGLTGTFDPQLLGIGNYTLTYHYINPITGCDNEEDRIINIVPLPGVFTPDTVEYCVSTNDIVLDGYGPLGGTWSGNGIINSNDGIFNATLAGGIGEYELIYNYSDANGCSAADTMIADVILGDIVSAGPDTSACIDAGLITLEGAFPVGGLWSGAGISDPAFGIFDPISVGAGTHTVYYTYGEGSCEKTDEKTIFIGNIPAIDAGEPELVCLDEPAYLLSGYNPTGGYWLGNGVDSAGLFDPMTAGVGSHTLTYTFVNSSTGCENSDTKTVTVAAIPNVYAGDTVEYCNSNTTIILDDYAPQGGTWSGPGIVVATGEFNSNQAGGEGTYNVVYAFTDANGCSSDDTLVIDIIYGDTVNAGPDFAICITDGLQVLAGASPAGGTWTGLGITDPIDGFFDPNITGGGNHEVYYTYGEETCEKTDAIIITVGTVPPVFPGPDEDICEETSAYNLTNFAPVGGVWTGVGITDPLGTFDPQVAGIGIHTLTYTYIQPVTGCQNSATKTINIEASPSVDAGGTTTYCDDGENIALTDFSPAGGTWSGPGIVNPVFGIFNTNNAGGVGTYNLVYTFTNANGCTSQDTLEVIVDPLPIVEAGPLDTICLDGGFLVLADYSPTGGVWSGPGIIDPFLGIFDPLVATAGVHTLTYTYGEGSCEVSDDKDIFVSALPNVVAGPIVFVCEDASAFTLADYSPVGGVWSGFGVTDPSLGIFDPQISGVGTHTITYSFTNTTTGCVGRTDKLIVVNALPGVYAEDSTIYCNINDDIILTGYGPAGGTWSGQGIIDAANGVFNTVLAGGEGEYTLTYGFTNQNGCYAEDSMIIDVIYGDTVEAGPDLAICIDEGITNLADFSPAGGIWSGIGIVDATSGVFDPQISGAGTYTLTYTYGEGTCEKTDTREIIVGGIPPVNAGSDITLCENEIPFMIDDFSPSGGTWIGSGVDPTGFFTPQSAGVGTHILTYTFVNNITGCENSDTKTITITGLPIVSVGDTAVYCNTPSTITLAGYSPLGGVWTGPGIVLPTGEFNTLQAGGEGTYDLVYTFTDINGCINTDTLIVDVIYGDTVEAGPNLAVCISDAAFALQGASPLGGTWSGTGIVDASTGTFDPSVTGTGTHTVTYTYGEGTCEKTDTRNILVGSVPNVEAGPNVSLCEDATGFTITGFSPLGGYWLGNGVDSSGVFDPQLAGVGIHNLEYTFINNITGCQDTDIKTVTINPLPLVEVGDTVTYCNTTNTITLGGYTPTGGIWTGPGIVLPSGEFNTSQAGGEGTYDLVYTLTDINGCINTDTLIVDVIYGDTVEAGPNLAVCISDAAFALQGASPLGGTWSGTGIVDASTGTFDPSVTGTGTHTVTYTYGEGTCEKTDTRNILVGSVPNVEAGPNVSLCEDATGFTITGFSPLGGYWLGNGVDSSGVFDPQLAGVGVHNLEYTFINNITGCQDTDIKTITINALPIVEVGDTVIYCNTPNTITLDGYTPIGGIWTGPGIVLPSGEFNTNQAGGEGTYDLVYTFTDVNGCINDDTLVIAVIYGDTVEAGPNLAVCISDAAFALQGASPLGGTWSGTGIVDASTGTFDPSVTGTGTHTVTYTYGEGTCEKTDTRNILVGNVPNVQAGADISLCEDAAGFTITGFSPLGGYWLGNGVDSSGVFDPQLAGVGIHDLEYTFINNITGCQDTDIKTITINPLPSVEVGDTVTYCNTTNTITLDGYTPTGGIWTGPGIVLPSGEFNTSQAGGEGTYDLVYTFTDINGCVNTDTLIVAVIYGDTVEAGLNLAVCISDAAFALQGASPLGGTWSGTGIVDASTGTFDPSIAGTGTHTVTYTYGEGTCEKTDTRNILVGSVPNVEAGPNVSLCEDATGFTITGFSPLGGYWLGNGVDSSGVFDPQLAGVGIHNLEYTFINNITGCQDTDIKIVTINALPVVNAGDTLILCDADMTVTLSGYTPTGGVWSGQGIVLSSGQFNPSQAGGIGTYNLDYTYTDANGCVNNDTLVIDVIYGDTVEAGPNFAICITDGIEVLADYSPLGGTWSGTGIVDETAGIFDPSVAGVGTHTISYTYGEGTCEKTDTRNIVIGDVPNVQAGPNVSLCEDETVFTITGFSPLGGYWLGNGVDSSGVFDPQLAGVGVHNLEYTFINNTTGCQNSDIKIITINALPIVEVGDAVLYCNTASTITLDGYSPLGGIWTGPGIVLPSGQFSTNQAGGEGTYNLVYTFTDANGCINDDTLIVDVIFGDTVEAGPNLAVCISDAAFALQGASPLGGTWSGTGIVDASTGTFDPSVAGTGTQTVTYTYGEGTCEKTDTRNILVGNVPNVQAGADVSLCEDATGFTITDFSPLGGYWLGNGVDSSGVFDPQLAGVGVHDLQYTFINNITGCQDTDIKTITINPLPSVEVGDTVTYCNTTNTIILDGYTPTGGIWTGPGIVLPSGEFNTSQAGGEGTYDLVYTFTDINGCVNTDTLIVDVIYGDTVEAGPNLAVCISDPGFALQGASPLGGTWSGTGIVDEATGTFDPSVAGAGTHTVTYTYGEGTCEKTDTRNILVGNVPNVQAGADVSLCEDATVFTISGFSPLGGYWLGNGVDSSGVFDPQLAGVGTHNLEYTFINNITGCQDTDIKTITINALPIVEVGDAVVYCNTASTITLDGYSPLGGIWTGPGIVLPSGQFSTNQAGGEGTYNLVYTFTDVNGCISDDTLIVDVIYGDTVEAGPNLAVCISDAAFALQGASPLGGTWSGIGIVDVATGTFDPAVAGVGTHTISYTYGEGTCEKTDTREILVGSVPNVEAGPNVSLCEDATGFTISGFSPLGGYWLGNGVDSSGVFDPQLAGVGVHNLEYTFINNITGCQNSDIKTITINALPLVEVGDTVTYCNTANTITLDGYTPTGGIWTGPGIVLPSGQFNTNQAGGEGTYNLVYTFTDANGCINDDTLVIDVIYGDTVEAGPNLAVCISDAAFALQGASPSGGTWSGTGIVDVATGTFDPAAAGSGTHTISYTYGEGTCEKTDTRNILVGNIPNAQAGPDLSLCEDATIITLTNFSPLGGFWLGLGVDSSGVFDPQIAGVGTHDLQYTFINNITGCQDADIKTITINPLPIVDAGDTLILCDANMTVTLDGFTPTGGIWTGQGVVLSSGQFNPSQAGGIGTYDLTYTYTDINGCINDDTLVIDVIYGDTVEAGPDFAICITDGIQILTDYYPLGGTWSGIGIIDAVSGTFDPAGAGNGVHTLSYTYGEGTCEKTDTREVTVGLVPPVYPGADDVLCEIEEAYNLTGFSPPGGIWTGFGITDPAGIFDPQITGVGVHVISYQYIDPVTGCEASDTKNVIIEATPIVDAGGMAVYCNNPFDIILENYTPSGGVWSGPGIVNAVFGVFNTEDAGGEGTYDLVYSYTNANGCFNIDTLIVDVIYGDTVEAGPDIDMCILDGPINIVGSPSGGEWSGIGITNAIGIFNPGLAGAGTHTVTYTYGEGTCEKTDTREIYVGDIPVVSAGEDQEVCIDAGIQTFNGYGPLGGYWAGNGVDSLGIFDPVAAGVGVHSLTYFYGDTVSGCINQDDKIVIVNALPLVNAGGSVIFCVWDDLILLDGYSPAGGTWSGAGVVDPVLGTFSTDQAGGIGMYELIYEFTDGNGCTNSDTLDVTVEAGQLLDPGPNESLCIDNGILQMASFTPLGGIWTGLGIIDGLNGVFDPAIAGVGVHMVTYTYGSGTCERSVDKTIEVYPLPFVNAGDDATICVDVTSHTLTPIPTGGTWFGQGVDPVTGIFNPQLTGLGTFDLVYLYQNPNTGCSNTDTLTLNVVPLPVPSMDHPAEVCVNDIVPFTNNSTGATTYLWQFGDGTNSSLETPEHIYTNGGNYTITLIAYTEFACSDTTTSTINVLADPLSDFVMTPNDGCAPLDVTFVNNSTGLNLSYAWDFGNGQVSVNQDPGIITFMQADVDTFYLVSLTVTNQCGVNTSIDTVFVSPVPVIDFGSDISSGCTPIGVNFTNNTTGLADQYYWDFGNGVTSTDSIPNTQIFTADTVVTYYTVILIASNSCGADTATTIIEVLPASINSFFNVDVTEGCQPLEVNFTNLATLGADVNWDFGDGNFSVAENPIHVFDTSGVFTVTQYAVNTCGIDSSTVEITVYPPSEVDFDMSDFSCVDDEIQFTNLSSDIVGSEWSFGDGAVSTLTNPSHSYDTPGTYTVTLIGYSVSSFCPESVSKEILIRENPLVDLGLDTTNGCQPLDINFENNSPIIGFTQWEFGDGNFSVEDNPNHIYDQPGTYTATLTNTDNWGCTSDTSILNIIVHPQPVPAYSTTAEQLCSQAAAVQFINESTLATGYTWDFGDGNSSPYTSPQHVFPDAGTYDVTLTATNQFGCIDSITEPFTVFDSPVADLSIEGARGCEDLYVQFYEESLFADSYEWDFGDGNTGEGNAPSHTYTEPGIYDVSLYITYNDVCYDSITLPEAVEVYQTPTANFEIIQGGDGWVTFNNLSENATEYFWDLGDGTTTAEESPTHRYPENGTVVAMLIAYIDGGCPDTMVLDFQPDFFYGLQVPNAFSPETGVDIVRQFFPAGFGLKEYHIQVFTPWGELMWESKAVDELGRPTEFWDGYHDGVIAPQGAYVWKVIKAEFIDGIEWQGMDYGDGKKRRIGSVTLLR